MYELTALSVRRGRAGADLVVRGFGAQPGERPAVDRPFGRAAPGERPPVDRPDASLG